MNNHQHVPAKIHNFSLAFQQMCSMVAIGQTKSQDETLRELILQTLVLFPEEKISNEHDFAKVLNTVFGLQIAEHEIKFSIERLVAEAVIKPSESGTFILDGKVLTALRTMIDSSIALETKVRDSWFEELRTKHPSLSFPDIWSALRSYLAGAFLRHGIQAVALLDPSLELDNVHSQSLTELLNSAVKGFSDELKLDAKNAISNFVATTGQSLERSKYIAQLADGAFSYFSLATDPEVATRFRDSLNPLMLFLDTNFLFGILGLAINAQTAVSEELIRVIPQYGFPFSLKRHIKTQNELISTAQKFEDALSQRQWSKTISRAALITRSLSGIEMKYHQIYIESGIDVKSFFLPYHHADILLNEKTIELYEPSEQNEKSQIRVATLIADYEEFLKRRGKDKPHKTIDHDMTILDQVRQLRTEAKSTLDAGALMITCDYSLYAFDWEISKKQGIKPSTVLPNLFWQVLRPFIPSDADFSQAFAQTFAIPEFRTIGSGAAEACSKMMNILAGYRNFPEETAVRMLSNDVLIDQLRKAENDEAFQNFVEAAIVNENAQLLGENILLAQKFETEQSKKNEVNQKLQETTQVVRQQEDYIRYEQEQRTKAEDIARKEMEERHKAEEIATAEKEQRLQTEEKLRMTILMVKAGVFGIIIVGIFELLTYALPWKWLVTNPNSYGLQGSFDLLLLAISFIIFVPKWRKYIWLPLILPIVLIALQLLGGPK